MDWPRIIYELQSCGLTETQIAKKTGASQQGVNFLKNGRITEPRWSWGEKLVKLHESYKREGFIHDREQTGKLGAALENGVSQASNDKSGGELQTA